MTFRRSARLIGPVIMLAACSQDTAGPGHTTPVSRMIVSNASSALSATSMRSDAPARFSASRMLAVASTDPNVAYISLLPQSYPTGVNAVVSNLRSGASVTAAMVDGGLDPIPLPAASGDSVEIAVQTGGGATIERLINIVPGRRPPRIVRTIPGRGKTGVPLNANIQIVFSEPIGPASLTSSSVELFRGSTSVTGTVEVLPGVTAAVVFRPAAPLDPNTDYELVVTNGIRDLDGDALDSEVSVPFTTGTTLEGPVASLSLIPGVANVSVGDQFQLIVTAKDANGAVLTGRAVTWWMTDTSVAKVTRTGLVTARGEGNAEILAEVDGLFIAMLVRVSNAMDPVASVTVSLDSASVLANGALELAAIVRDADGNLLERRVIHWTSSNASVATVQLSATNPPPGTIPSGPLANMPPSALYWADVTGVASGVAKIVATIDGKSDTAVVTVGPAPPIVGFILSADTATLLLRQTAQISGLSTNAAGGRVSVASDQVQWESSNIGVAVVDAAGMVTGVGAGSATITGHWNTYTATDRITVVQVAFETLSVGRTHTCGLASGGATYCWGANDFGQAGRPGLAGGSPGFPAQVFSAIPVRVADGLTFVGVSAGGFHTCGLTAGGAAYCWGYNGEGSLGTDNFNDTWRPAPVSGGLTFVELDAGTSHTCGLTAAGAAYCWGSNRGGQLGVSGLLSSPRPVPVGGGHAFASLSVGGSHTCGLTSDGVAYCWGDNAGSQLGAGGSITSSSTPLPVSGGLTFSVVRAGEAHTCGVTVSASLYCWGWNFDGQLGNGTQFTPSAVPVAVATGLQFTAIGPGESHTCAIDASSAAYCWGQNSGGKLGLGTVTQESFATPQPVVGGLMFDKITAGRVHTCAATIAGVWYCWGHNESGVLGVGTTTDSGTPLKILGQQ